MRGRGLLRLENAGVLECLKMFWLDRKIEIERERERERGMFSDLVLIVLLLPVRKITIREKKKTEERDSALKIKRMEEV